MPTDITSTKGRGRPAKVNAGETECKQYLICSSESEVSGLPRIIGSAPTLANALIAVINTTNYVLDASAVIPAHLDSESGMLLKAVPFKPK